jgi:hypothetical protein
MSDITFLAQLINGANRNQDLTIATVQADTWHALSLFRIGSVAVHTDLNKTQFDTLLAQTHSPTSDNQNVVAGLGLSGGGSGATVNLAVAPGNGISVAGGSVVVVPDTTGGSNLAKAINVSANGVAVKVDGATIVGDASTGQLKVPAGGLFDSEINAAAAIAVSKLAALTAQRALISDSGGHLDVSNVTSTEIGYVSGVTSAIQTQINTKAATTDVILTSGANAMQADLNLNSHKITGLSDGANPADAVNFSQLSLKADASAVILKNGTVAFTGAQSMGGFKLTHVANGSASDDAAAYGQVSVKADSSAVIFHDGSVAFTADQSMGGFNLTNLADPLDPQHAATKAYVDAVATGLHINAPVDVATTIALDTTFAHVGSHGTGVSYTSTGTGPYTVTVTSPNHDLLAGESITVSSGTSPNVDGVQTTIAPITTNTFTFQVTNDPTSGTLTWYDNDNGAGSTLTFNTNNSKMVDGVTLTLNMRVLVKDQANSFEDGIYVVSDAGSVGTPVILTRATDFDGSPDNEVVPGDFVFVTGSGLTQNLTGWVVANSGHTPIRVDTDDIVWHQFSGAGTILAGLGLHLTGNTMDVVYDNVTIGINGSNQIYVKNSGIDTAQLNNLSVTAGKIANNTITATQIAAATITATQIASATITSTQLAANSVTSTQVASSVAGNGLQGGNGSALSIKHDGQGLDTSSGTLVIVPDATAATISKSASGIKVADLSLANGQISATAAISLSKLASGLDGQIIVANSSGVPTYVNMTGDVTITNAGLTAIGSLKVTNGMLAGSIDDSKLNQLTSTNKVAGSAVQLATSGGLQNLSGLAVKVSDFAGFGLQDNGSNALTIKLATASGLVCDTNGLRVGSTTATIIPVAAGEAFTALTPVYVRWGIGANGETPNAVYKADKNAGTVISPIVKYEVIGMVYPPTSVSAGQSIDVTSVGFIVVANGTFSSTDVGLPMWLGTLGGYLLAPPTGSNDADVRCGTVADTNRIWVMASNLRGINAT